MFNSSNQSMVKKKLDHHCLSILECYGLVNLGAIHKVLDYLRAGCGAGHGPRGGLRLQKIVPRATLFAGNATQLTSPSRDETQRLTSDICEV